jgi:hypothetical protein
MKHIDIDSVPAFFNKNIQANNSNLIENDYMSKFQNLEEMKEFFSSPLQDIRQNKNMNIINEFTFKDPNKSMNNTSSNFKNIFKKESKNTFIIKAIFNLLEDMNISQLKYLRRTIENKLMGDSDSII